MGSSFSNPKTRGVLDEVTCDIHDWTSEFGKEYAKVYRAWDTKPGICTLCISKCHDKVIYTFYDALCHDNFVAANIEFESIRDGDGSYKFGGIKVKEFGENFIVRRRRSIGPELLFLRYETGRRTNQLALYREGEDYDTVFEIKSPLFFIYIRVHLSSDSSIGLTSMAPDGDSSIFTLVHGKPPEDVMKEVNDIRSKFMKDAGTGISHGNNTNGTSLSYSQHDLILNTGQTQGFLNGSNLRDCQFHIERP